VPLIAVEDWIHRGDLVDGHSRLTFERALETVLWYAGRSLLQNLESDVASEGIAIGIAPGAVAAR